MCGGVGHRGRLGGGRIALRRTKRAVARREQPRSGATSARRVRRRAPAAVLEHDAARPARAAPPPARPRASRSSRSSYGGSSSTRSNGRVEPRARTRRKSRRMIAHASPAPQAAMFAGEHRERARIAARRTSRARRRGCSASRPSAPGAREPVEHARARRASAEHVEQRLAQRVRRRPDARRPAAPRAGGPSAARR